MVGRDLDTGENELFPDERVYSIFEVFYKNGVPDSYIESKKLLRNVESIEDLKWIHKKIKKAFKKPIIDLDNFPKEYKDSNS
jgi:hypothetical protein